MTGKMPREVREALQIGAIQAWRTAVEDAAQRFFSRTGGIVSHTRHIAWLAARHAIIWECVMHVAPLP